MKILLLRSLSSRPWVPAYNDPPPPPPPPAPVDPPVDPPVEPPANPDDDKPTISKAQMNKIVQERLGREQKKAAEEKQKVIERLTQLERAKGLSDKERGDLATQIEDLKTSMLTKEQQAELTRKKLEGELTGKLKEVESRAEKNWRLYEGSTITREITDAAAKHDAFRASQVVKHLRDITQLVEDKDPETSQGLGTYTPRVKFPDTKDGKPITLDLTVEEAVRRMKDLPEEYGNLFKSGVAGGLGGSSGAGGAADDGTPPSDPVKYRAWREKQKKLGKL